MLRGLKNQGGSRGPEVLNEYILHGNVQVLEWLTKNYAKWNYLQLENNECLK